MKKARGHKKEVFKTGSSPRCISLVASTRSGVAARLTDLVKLNYVTVSVDDFWMPCVKPFRKSGKTNVNKATYAQLNHDPDFFQDSDISQKLGDWWFAASRRGRTPIWDVASTCTINEKQGLLLVEGKAHSRELYRYGKKAPKKSPRNCSSDSWKNHKGIGAAIEEANVDLRKITGGSWALCRDRHYQLSHQFAWSWKLASLGIPVVLVYLGFLDTTEMATKNRKIFRSHDDWEQQFRKYARAVVDDSCWEKKLSVNRTPFQPLIRAAREPLLPIHC